MYCITSGNETVDMMQTISLTGNVIPHIWYKQIVRENGKPYHLAITLLADIVYWYRPIEVRDEASGNVIGLQKRFKSDLLQKTYDQYADFFGESDRSVKAALKHLEEMGLITRVFRTIKTANEIKIPNVMYISLNAEKLAEITYPKQQEQKTRMTDMAQKEDFSEGVAKECHTCDKIMSDVVQNFVTPPTEFCHTPLQENATYVAVDSHTNTENIAEITTKNTTENKKVSNPIFQSSDVASSVAEIFDEKKDGNEWTIDLLYTPEERREQIFENTEYYWHMMNDDEHEKKVYKDLVDIVCDVVCGKYRGEISVGGAMMPVVLVKERLWSLNAFHIEYVRSCLEKLDNHNGIRNIRSYMLTCLYNAPVTMDQYVTQMVHHDRSMGKLCGRSTCGHNVHKSGDCPANT